MKLKLKVITPTFVGSGETLSPTLDFVFRNNQIILIDQNKLTNWLFENKDRDLYVRDLTKLALRGEGNIGRFFSDYKLNLDDFKKISYNIAFSIKERTDTYRLFRQVKLPISGELGAYIPGSTIKGLLRSALMFRFIQDNGGWEKVNNSKHILENYRPNRGYIGEDIFREEMRFMSTDAMRFIQVTDTSMVPLEKLKVFLLERITRSNSPIPQLILGLPKDTEFNLEINILKGFKDSSIPEYWKRLFEDEKVIFDVLQLYMITLMEYEKTLVEKANNSISKPLSSIYARYIAEEKNFIGSKEKSSIIRIGFGKTYYFNSIGYFFTEEEKKRFIVVRGRNYSSSIFPSSRWIIRVNQGEIEPPGLCMIYM